MATLNIDFYFLQRLQIYNDLHTSPLLLRILIGARGLIVTLSSNSKRHENSVALYLMEMVPMQVHK
jgi:hypothetical protein